MGMTHEKDVKEEDEFNGELGPYTLFSVTRETRESRSKRIRALFDKQPVLGYLVAVFDFEWTIRRAVLMMSGCPIMVIKARFDNKKYSGWSAYQGCWTRCVQGTRDKPVPSLACVALDVSSEEAIHAKDKQAIQSVMNLRNKLVHGLSGSLQRDKADAGFALLLSMTKRIVKFVEKQCGQSMFERICKPRSRCKKCLRWKRCRFQKERRDAKNRAHAKCEATRKGGGAK